MSDILPNSHSEQLLDPTRTMYSGLQDAFDYMNEHLFLPAFGQRLPNCLLTLRATGKTFGYFSAERFVGDDGKLTHEIALNPASFACRSVELSLSTMAHEMCHLQPLVDKSVGRSTYHNTEFAARMEKIGLITSTTGRPGGKRVAQQMSHYIDPNGEFIRIIRPFLAGGYRARWADRFTGALRDEWEPDHPPLTPGITNLGPSLVDVGADDSDRSQEADADRSPGIGARSVASPPPAVTGAVDDAGEPDPSTQNMNSLMSSLSQDDTESTDNAPPGLPVHEPMEEPLASRVQGVFVHGKYGKTKGATRHKYSCPQCTNVAVWGRPNLHINCCVCDQRLADQG